MRRRIRISLKKVVFEYFADANLRCNFNQSDKMPFIRWNRFPPERK
ncbi:hypothetical protein NEIPOLOT_00188 [Neisseria polysaccharea ATCC 43768]|nr:hypothetical protein NEIPOLOT_00188 [Neisseria polysaccharea ATCC 43768]